MLPYLKFRSQRLLRRWRRDILQSRRSVVTYFDLHVWGRWRQLGIIRRFAALWWAVLIICLVGSWVQIGKLNAAFEMAGPAPGGTYVEGIVGKVKSINPVLPESSASSDVSRLIFNGLTRVSPGRTIEGDLAQSWSVSDDGKTYTFKLHPGIRWQDGQPLTADDVAFTIGLIQNPDTRSPLASSWQGVTVGAPDKDTVLFTLPGVDVSFITSTTVGIVPKHLLQTVSPADLRVADFNQHPIGTGPFKLDDVNASGMMIDLVAFTNYFRGQPQLDHFTVRLFDTTEEAQRSYAQRQLTAVGRLPENDDITKLGPVHAWAMNLSDEVGIFMRATGVLSDKNVRGAIAMTVNRAKVATAAGQISPNLITEPILPGQLGYTGKYTVPALDVAAANTLLDNNAWTRDKDGLRHNGDQTLKLKLATSSAANYVAATAELERELKAIGIQLDKHEVDTSELQQTYIRPRNYDLLLFGISIGPDSDVYAYWHSSQISDPGLNLSQYKSADADKLLEAGRLTTNTAVRQARYEKFLSIWTADLPAVMLYQPEYMYATKPNVFGVEARKLVDPSDRFYDVENWTVNTRPVQRTK